MGLGLLGALGGLGKGMQDFGNALFSEEMEKQRRAELQKIRDQDYSRSRKDFLADRDAANARQDTIVEAANSRTDTLRKEDRTNALADDLRDRTRQLADIASQQKWVKEQQAELYTDFQVDDTGSVVGFTATGESKTVGKLANMNPILSNSIDAYQATMRDIQYNSLDRKNSPEIFNQLDTYRNMISRAMASSAENMGMPLEPAGPSYSEVLELGGLLFSGQREVEIEDQGTFGGQELIDAQDDYRERYPDMYQHLMQKFMQQ